MKTAMLLLLMVTCSLTTSAQKIVKIERASDHSTYIKGNDFEGVIFDKDFTSRFFPKIDSMSKRFSPTVDEILTFERALASHIKELNKHRQYQTKRNAIDRNLRRYRRQYYGYIDLKGRKIIGVNSFIDNSNDNDWRTEYYLIFDGGASVWEVMFDVSSGKLFAFGTNGIA